MRPRKMQRNLPFKFSLLLGRASKRLATASFPAELRQLYVSMRSKVMRSKMSPPFIQATQNSNPGIIGDLPTRRSSRERQRSARLSCGDHASAMSKLHSETPASIRGLEKVPAEFNGDIQSTCFGSGSAVNDNPDSIDESLPKRSVLETQQDGRPQMDLRVANSGSFAGVSSMIHTYPIGDLVQADCLEAGGSGGVPTQVGSEVEERIVNISSPCADKSGSFLGESEGVHMEKPVEESGDAGENFDECLSQPPPRSVGSDPVTPSRSPALSPYVKGDGSESGRLIASAASRKAHGVSPPLYLGASVTDKQSAVSTYHKPLDQSLSKRLPSGVGRNSRQGNSRKPPTPTKVKGRHAQGSARVAGKRRKSGGDTSPFSADGRARITEE